MLAAPPTTPTDDLLSDDVPGLDAPGLDAPGLDAPGLDAPGLDAPAPDTSHDTALPGRDVVPPCRTADPDLWFAESPADVEDAKALCVPCPLREACLAGALERREPWGVWGGQLLVAGVVVPYKRPRGRPRKTPLASTTAA